MLQELLSSHSENFDFTASDSEAALPDRAAQRDGQEEEHQDDQKSSSDASNTGRVPEIRYTCRKCRSLVFLETELEEHEPKSQARTVRFSGKHFQAGQVRRKHGWMGDAR